MGDSGEGLRYPDAHTATGVLLHRSRNTVSILAWPTKAEGEPKEGEGEAAGEEEEEEGEEAGETAAAKAGLNCRPCMGVKIPQSREKRVSEFKKKPSISRHPRTGRSESKNHQI